MEHRAHQTYKRAFTSATWISNLPSTSKTDSMLELPTVYCGLSMGSLTLPQTSARSILLMGTFVRTSKLLAPTDPPSPSAAGKVDTNGRLWKLPRGQAVVRALDLEPKRRATGEIEVFAGVASRTETESKR